MAVKGDKGDKGDFFIDYPAVPEERDWKTIMQQAGILKL